MPRRPPPSEDRAGSAAAGRLQNGGLFLKACEGLKGPGVTLTADQHAELLNRRLWHKQD